MPFAFQPRRLVPTAKIESPSLQVMLKRVNQSKRKATLAPPLVQAFIRQEIDSVTEIDTAATGSPNVLSRCRSPATQWSGTFGILRRQTAGPATEVTPENTTLGSRLTQITRVILSHG